MFCMEPSEELDQFDSAVTALGNRYRRRLLIALLDHNPQDDEDAQQAEQALGATSGPGTDDEIVETELIHNHLPKLEELGYISWNRETGAISTGPNWSEIKPLLELLDRHEDELPDGWL